MGQARPWSEELQAECKAFSEDLGLSFMICAGTVTPFAGWKSEEREATDEEKTMWSMIGGPT